PGTYYENVNFNGKNITLTSLFLTTQDYSYIDSTIINGNQDGSVIRFSLGEDTTAILCGFTITNGYAERGGGLYCSSSNPSLNNLIIIGNTASSGAGIYCSGSSPSLNNVTISNNIANDSGGGINICESSPNLVNCILWNNTPQEIYLDTYSSVTVTYSDIQVGWDGDGNISDNPCFADTASGDYSLTWNDSVRSACIDTGDPETEWDEDNTLPDMGAIPATTHNYDYRTLYEDWNWFSFPVRDTVTIGNVDALEILDPILDNMEEVIGLNEVNQFVRIYWNPDSMAWENEIGDFRSVDGYKIEMNAPDTLPISGFLEDPDAVITMEAEAEYGNWIGYFIEHSMKPQDAFSQVWDKLTYIKAQNWTILFDKQQQAQPPAVCPTVDYGKSYVVGVSEDCSFTWGLPLAPAEPYEKPETVVFGYQENSDYMPIFVDSTEAVTGIDEIGVFLGDECVGASVVEGYPVFIPAYIEEDSTGNKDFNELTFQIATYGKGGKRSIPAFVYNEMKDAFVKEPIILDNKSYAIVRLGTGAGIEFPKEFTLYQNYPNPITNSITISFIPSPGVEKSEIKIYNIKGQLVRTLTLMTNDKCPMTKVVWDGKDDNGKRLGNGIYFYKLISGDKSAIKKMVLMH
ncbi:MAG: T9SS type A sorting domain-containing protein, partial [Candidatus Cloacimonadota bacterium]|nr:T9SS type A sorting domain-containing protein [Candidatus Cloacimonadota bacterium]